MAKWPSEQLRQLMDGKVKWDDAPESIRSWSMFFIHETAKRILSMPKDKRRGAIDKAPETVRPVLEAEIKRVWKLWREAS